MTDAADSPAASGPPEGQSLLPFAPAEIIRSGVRVNMATLAKMVGVSKQAVSSWKRRGLITLGPDGLVNPTEAMRQYSRNADPARVRAKALADPMRQAKTAREENNALRKQVAQLREQIMELQSRRIAMQSVNLAVWAVAQQIAELLPNLVGESRAPQGAQRVALRVNQLFARMLYDDDDESLQAMASQFDLAAEPKLPDWFPACDELDATK